MCAEQGHFILMRAGNSVQNGFICMVPSLQSTQQEKQVPNPRTSKETAPMAQSFLYVAKWEPQTEGPKLAEGCSEMCQDIARWMCQAARRWMRQAELRCAAMDRWWGCWLTMWNQLSDTLLADTVSQKSSEDVNWYTLMTFYQYWGKNEFQIN